MYVLQIKVTMARPILPSGWAHGHVWTNKRTPHPDGPAGWVSSNATDWFFFRYAQADELICVFSTQHTTWCYFLWPGWECLYLPYPLHPCTLFLSSPVTRVFWVFLVVIMFSPRFSLNRSPLPLGGSCHCGKRFHWSTPLPWGRSQDICITKFFVTECSTHIRAHCSTRKEPKYLC